MSEKESVNAKPRRRVKEKHITTSNIRANPCTNVTPERSNVANTAQQQKPSKASKISSPNVSATNVKQSTFVGASIYMRANGVFSAANAAVSIFASAAYSRPLDSSTTDQIELVGSTSYNAAVIPMEKSTGTVKQKSDSSISAKSADRLHAIIVCGPSGSGKSTLLKKLIFEFPDCFAFCVSHTTRKPRPGEINGKDYHFVTKSVFDQMVKNNDFFENTEFSGNNYGTSREALRDVVNSGRICIKDVDLNGVTSFMNSDVNPLLICIKAPNIDILRKRLLDRKTETEETLRRRIEKAKEEEQVVSEYQEYFEKIIINDDLDTAYGELRDFLLPEIDKLKAANKLKT